MLFAFAFHIDKDIIKVYNHKNIKFFCQNLIDVALKCGQCIGQSKKHYLVLKMIVADLKDRFSSTTFFDPFLMISIGQIELDKTSNSTWLIK